jgi:hypothetical protein
VEHDDNPPSGQHNVRATCGAFRFTFSEVVEFLPAPSVEACSRAGIPESNRTKQPTPGFAPTGTHRPRSRRHRDHRANAKDEMLDRHRPVLPAEAGHQRIADSGPIMNSDASVINESALSRKLIVSLAAVDPLPVA